MCSFLGKTQKKFLCDKLLFLKMYISSHIGILKCNRNASKVFKLTRANHYIEVTLLDGCCLVDLLLDLAMKMV